MLKTHGEMLLRQIILHCLWSLCACQRHWHLFLESGLILAGDDFDTNYYDDMFYDDTEETQDDGSTDSDQNAGRNLSCTATESLSV